MSTTLDLVVLAQEQTRQALRDRIAAGDNTAVATLATLESLLAPANKEHYVKVCWRGRRGWTLESYPSRQAAEQALDAYWRDVTVASAHMLTNAQPN